MSHDNNSSNRNNHFRRRDVLGWDARKAGMMAEIQIKNRENSNEKVLTLEAALKVYFTEDFDKRVLSEAIKKIVEDVVDAIVKEKFGEILSKVDTQAIANLAMARCSNVVADELKKKA